MILLKDILKKLNITSLDISDDICIDSIKRNKNNREVFFVILSEKDLEEILKKKIKEIFSKNLKEYKIYIDFKSSSLYKSEDDLICAEILKYNPSSKIWIGDIEIKKDKNLIDIKLPTEEAYYTLTKNGFGKYLENELKIFDSYKIKFNFVRELVEEENIETFISQIDEAEEVISSKH
ncbi:MAG: PolC-type DNA polymerase III, partial [Peptoniphilus harei]|nr:PolC-type DNA polymerase III [Peptoniphilus harei]